MAFVDIKSLSLKELELDLKEKLSYPKFRAKQIFSWLTKGTTNFDDMSDLSKGQREKLKKIYYIANAEIEKKLVSKKDGTVKYLFKLNDGEFIESVLMKYHHGYTICISTQVGCKMGCKFCATGLSGYSRNLTPSEMLAQIQSAQIDNNIRISNVVLMGMGEPLDNYDNVVKFLKLVSCDDGMNIGNRHISLSTCGIVNRIYDLAQENFQITLSVSLHAPNDDIRNKTMPINQRFNIDKLITACKYYVNKTGRRISFEYAMINGLNDSDACAYELAHRLQGILCHVNLIPVNSSGNKQLGFEKSTKIRLNAFSKILGKKKIPTTVRRTLGADINASCGQLRRSETLNRR